MSTTMRQMLRSWVGRVVGERPIPLGRVARDRRTLRRALAPRPVGRVLVVGPGLAARQAFPNADVDVAGTSPHSTEVTVCSAVSGRGSLPPDRWDTIVISEPSGDLTELLRAIQPACRRGARVVLLHCPGAFVPDAAAADGVRLTRGTSGRLRDVWMTEVPS
jgi:hypothetical protein